jgi:hypothetical protein
MTLKSSKCVLPLGITQAHTTRYANVSLNTCFMSWDLCNSSFLHWEKEKTLLLFKEGTSHQRLESKLPQGSPFS